MVNVRLRYINYLRESRRSYSETTVLTLGNPTTNPIANPQLQTY